MAEKLVSLRRPFTLACVIAFAYGLACTSLPDIPKGTCGNHVLEAGEDCDTDKKGDLGTVCRAPGQPNACRFDCSADDTGIAKPCPRGWACGSDAICRAAAGKFEPLSGQLPSDAVTLGLADYNGDRLFDIRETTTTETRIRFGSITGDFGDVFHIPMQDPNPASGDLSGDGLVDLAFSSNGQVAVWQGTSARVLSPVPYPSFPLPPKETDATFTLAHVFATHPGEQIVLFMTDAIVARNSLDAASSDDTQGNFKLKVTLRKPSDLVGRPVAAQFDEAPDSPCDELVYAFKTDEFVEVLPTCNGTGPNRLAARPPVKVMLGRPVGSGFLVADLNGDGHLDLLIDAPNAGDPGVVQAFGNGDGTFSAVVDMTSYYGTFPLAAGLVTKGDPFPDFVDTKGNLVLRSTSPGVDADAGFDAGKSVPFMETTLTSPNGVVWTEAAILDVNGNGLLDVVCGGDKEIDFFNGTGTPLANPVPYPIDGAASQLVFGDFDGDLATDIAYRETPTNGADSLSVLFGANGGLPQAPVSLGALGAIQLLQAGALSDTEARAHGLSQAGGSDGIADITVLLTSGADSTNRFISTFFGTSDRHLQSPYGLARPRTNGASAGPLGFIQAAGSALAIGNFSAPNTKHADLGAVALDLNATASSVPPFDVRFWLVQASSGAALATTPTASAKVDGFQPVTVSQALAWENAQSVALDLDPDAANPLDEMVSLVPPRVESGLEGKLFVARAAGGTFAVNDGVPIGRDSRTTTEPARWKLVAADIDGDGAKDIVALVNTANGPSVQAFLNARSGKIDGSPVVVGLPANVKPRSVAALNADGEPGKELAVLTDMGLFLAKLDASKTSFHVADKMPGLASDGGSVVAAGDVNGDGIDDLAVVGNGVLQVFKGLPVNP